MGVRRGGRVSAERGGHKALLPCVNGAANECEEVARGEEGAGMTRCQCWSGSGS